MPNYSELLAAALARLDGIQADLHALRAQTADVLARVERIEARVTPRPPVGGMNYS